MVEASGDGRLNAYIGERDMLMHFKLQTAIKSIEQPLSHRSPSATKTLRV
jgi:hypothetical protein